MTATERRRRRWRRSPQRTSSELAFERLGRSAEKRLAQWRRTVDPARRRALLAWFDHAVLKLP